MPVQVTCPECATVFPSVPDDLAGKTIRCKSCGAAMSVPSIGKPLAAKPLAAKPVVRTPDPEEEAPRPVKTVRTRRTDDDDDAVDALPVKSTRLRRDDDDDDDDKARKGQDKPKKKSSALPLILVGVFSLLLLVAGGGAAALYFGGMFDSDSGLTQNTAPMPVPGPMAGVPPMPNVPSEAPPALPGDDPTTKMKEPSPSAPSTPKKVGPSTPTTPKKAPPKPADPPPSIKPKVNTGEPRGPVNRTNLDTATRERLKKATVYFECEAANGGGGWTGSGWFGIEENLIWTNAHVMGMDTPGGKPPSKMTVYLNPGTPQQRKIEHQRLELLAVDRERDLALLRVNGEDNLPVPMQIRLSSELGELDGLVILGYPGGSKLSSITGNTKQPAVTVNMSSVGSIRRDDFGNISAVQFNGGSAPGGSGGPIVDLEGNVVAVVYMGPADATLASTAAFGVPTEYVQGLFAGRIADVEYGQPYRANGKIRVPVTATAIDPFNRIKQVGIGCWVADANSEVRAPGLSRTGMQPSDSQYVETTLKYSFSKDKQIATGEIEFPELQAGRVYMSQPFYSNGALDKYYLAGNTVKLIGPPVDREPADLIARLRSNPGLKRLVTLTQESSLMEFEDGDGVEKKQRVLRNTELKAFETVLNPMDQAAVATLRLQFDSLTLKQRLPLMGIDIEMPAQVRKLLNDNIKMIQGFAHVGKDGQVYKTYTDVRNAGPMGPVFQGITNGAITALKQASVPLPNKRMNPMESWKYQRDETMFLTYVSDLEAGPPAAGPGGRPQGPPKQASRTKELRYRVDATYTYLGSRVRAGQKEAVVKVEANIVPAAGSRSGTASGEIKGYVSLDTDTGVVLDAEIEREFELDTSEAGIKKRISGIENSKLTRGTAIRN